MIDNVSISIFGKFVNISRCGKHFQRHENVTDASLRRLDAVISRYTWHLSIGGGRRYYGPLLEKSAIANAAAAEG